jgi:diguanylate cyclase (GGDEF)-like protein/PAS domain S-box-containing protein
MAANDALRRREELFGRLAEALPIGLIQIGPDREILYRNRRLGEILGTRSTRGLDDALGGVVADDRPALDSAIGAALRDGTDADLELQVRRPGELVFRRAVVKVRALHDEGPAGVIVCIEDVTERAELQAELERRATFDILTACLNRASVLSALETSLAHGDSPYVAVVFVDVDNFKTMNDTHGHAFGDDLLIAIAKRLRSNVRDGDLVGRLGGDEFLVVCPEVRSVDEATHIGERLSDALHDDITVGTRRVALRSSLGVACAARANVSAEELVTQADVAMYDAKRHDRGMTVRLVDA